MGALIRDDRPTVPCGLCGDATPFNGSRRCDRCQELETRIERDPELACKILGRVLGQGDANATDKLDRIIKALQTARRWINSNGKAR